MMNEKANAPMTAPSASNARLVAATGGKLELSPGTSVRSSVERYGVMRGE